MAGYIARFEDNRFMVYRDSLVFGRIEFDDNRRVSASLFTEGGMFRAEPAGAGDKNIVISKDGSALFKFKFDYLWGGAEIQVEGEDTGYDVTGKLFKPGTRLVDADGKDLVVVVSGQSIPPEMKIGVPASDVSPLMIMATLYYHIYTSAANTFLFTLINAT